MSIIVRVKRRRSQSSTDKIYIIENDEPNVKKLSSNLLSQSISDLKDGNSINPNKFIQLNKIMTIDSDSTEALVLALDTNPSLDNITSKNTVQNNSNNNSSIYFTTNKSKISTSSANTSLVVDMTQLPVNFTPCKVDLGTKTRILNPAIRQLEMAIIEANKTGNLNNLALAISSGADINHRTSDSTGGLTALMVVVKHCNLRFVKRLIGQCANILIQNSLNQTALDIAETITVPRDRIGIKLEIQQWLYRTAVRQKMQQLGMCGKPIDPDLPIETMQTTELSAREEISSTPYVYDIFRYATESSESLKTDISSSSSNIVDPDLSSAAGKFTRWDSLSGGPLVPVPGLRIDANDDTNLAFEYDSDWSALGEDSDSNDENHPNNDYPEEEEESEEEDKFDEDESSSGWNFAARKSRFRDDCEGFAGDEEGLGGRAWGVGRVLRTHTVGGGWADLETRETGTLQRIWGEDEDYSDEEEKGEEYDGGKNTRGDERIADMRRRTGMQFASNPREFESNGLARYGAELEDDEDDFEVMRSLGPPESRPDKYNIVYDSDLDHMDDD